MESDLMRIAERYAPDRTVTLGRIAVRVSAYRGEGQPVGSPVPGLIVKTDDPEETALFHRSTGVYGFLTLSSGPHIVRITDPQGRYLPCRLRVEVPPGLAAVSDLLGRGAPVPDDAPGPGAADALVRPAVNFSPVPGDTVIWGQVTGADTRPLRFARIAIDTVFDGLPGRVVTYSDLNGVYFARLSGERAEIHLPDPVEGGAGDEADALPPPDPDAAPESDSITAFERAVVVHKLKPADEALLNSDDPLRAFPLEFDDLDPDGADSPYSAVAFSLREIATGGERPNLIVHAGKTRRWDIIET